MIEQEGIHSHTFPVCLTYSTRQFNSSTVIHSYIVLGWEQGKPVKTVESSGRLRCIRFEEGGTLDTRLPHASLAWLFPKIWYHIVGMHSRVIEPPAGLLEDVEEQAATCVCLLRPQTRCKQPQVAHRHWKHLKCREQAGFPLSGRHLCAHQSMCQAQGPGRLCKILASMSRWSRASL